MAGLAVWELKCHWNVQFWIVSPTHKHELTGKVVVEVYIKQNYYNTGFMVYWIWMELEFKAIMEIRSKWILFPS